MSAFEAVNARDEAVRGLVKSPLAASPLAKSPAGFREGIGSLSTRTFKATSPSFERLRLGRGLLRMTYPGLPTLCCRRRRELSGFGGVVKVVGDLSGS